jgi:outer membrane putative beta-barrel porin/alpha-amylase
MSVPSLRFLPIFLLIASSVMALEQDQAPPKDPELVTDRPDVTESSIVIPKASLQAENGVAWTDDHGQRTFDVSETLLRFGVSARTELRLGVPNYLFGLHGRNSPSGFADVSIGVKQQLGPLPGRFDLSVIAAVSIPTGADRTTSHGYDPFVKFPWSKELKNGWSFGGMQSVFWNTQGTRRNATWEPTFYLEKQIREPWDVFAEYAGDYSQRGGPRQLIHFGTAYKVTPKNQIDFHFGFGLSHATPSQFFAAGYSFRVDRLWGR